MPVKVRSHIDERGLRTLAEVGSAADHFVLTNPNYYCRSNEPSFPSNQHNSKRMEYSTRRTDLPDTHRTVNAKSSETGGESRNIASRGFISADESCTSSSPVTILRDSAADISLVLKEAVPNPDCYTGDMEYGKLFSDVPRLCPLLEHDVEPRDAPNQYAKLPIASMQRRGHSYKQRFNA
ncbi:uncharacterized protein LOC119575862 [Penaeus monodon]|uniref:uncharacterized protein LOC119575862 n=1 Tax=Penaeus monodon TaxID=6687 RepID=UPI0018A78A8F|nr:uncharacterized protein LOC119575862 [Penaeus monodon]